VGERTFVARDEEQQQLEHAVEAALLGTPAFVLIHGEPGVGKTALAHRAVAGREGLQVVTAAGDLAELDVAWGYVDQLARSITPTAADELAAMASLADPSAVGAWLLGLLGEMEQAGPVALVLDDLQWADALSVAALLFAVRRLRRERIVVLGTARRGELDQLPQGLHQLLRGPIGATVALEGLDAEGLGDLVRAAGHELAPSVLIQLRDLTEGNPLHVLALLDDTGGALDAGLDGRPLPAPPSYRSLVLGRLASCRPATERLVLAAATLGQRAPVATVQAVAGLEDLGEALDEAARLDLLVETPSVAGPVLAFTHPMVRAAVYNDMGSTRRAELHRNAAAVTTDEWSRLRHLAAATSGAAPELADELAEFALGRRGTGPSGNAEAAAAFRLAAAVTADEPVRQDLLLRALECQLALGDGPAARELAAVTADFPRSARQLYLQGSIDVISGEVQQGVDRFHRAWELTDDDTDPSLRSGIASQIAIVALNRGEPDEVLRWGRHAAEAGGVALLSDPVVTSAMALAGQGRRREVQDVMPPVPEDGLDLFAIPRALATGVAALWDDDPEAAHEQLTMAYEASRAFGVFFAATLSLVYLSETEYRLGRWDEAVRHGELAASTAQDADQGWFLSLAHGNAALPLIARGEHDTASEHVDVAMAAGFMPTYELWARYAAGFAAAVAGDLDHAARVLEPLRLGEFGPAVEAVKPWRLLSAEVLARGGDAEGAEALLIDVDEQLADRDLPSVETARWRVGALAALAADDGDLALERFAVAEARAADCPSPVEVALVQLDHGALLRRRNQRRDAAARLEAAAATFDRLGARPWAARAHQELAACGLTPARRGDEPAVELTPSERTVAVLVAGGARTKEVAAELVVSPKTVEYHLGNIYRKLGVANRAQLAARFAELSGS
jgi:DNA-binding CsgD family transcriptional regulator